MDQVEKTITKQNLKRSYNPNYCEITNEGKIKCYSNNGDVLETDNSDNTLDVDVQGEKPKSGIIVINNNNTINIYYINVIINNTIYTKNENGDVVSIAMSEAQNESANTICKSLTGEKSTELGTAYVCKVNDNMMFKFYVLSTEGSEENQKVNLIMDRNIKNDNEWVGNNTTMILNLFKKLHNATKEWSNIQNVNYTYQDFANRTAPYLGYKKIDIQNGKGYIEYLNGTQDYIVENSSSEFIKTRLPSMDEIINAYTTDEAWLGDNLNIEKEDSYATLDTDVVVSSSFYSQNLIYSIIMENMGGEIVPSYRGDRPTGIRPVITVPLNQIS